MQCVCIDGEVIVFKGKDGYVRQYSCQVSVIWKRVEIKCLLIKCGVPWVEHERNDRVRGMSDAKSYSYRRRPRKTV